MKIVAAKCTQCGADINVDASLLKGSCPFCHTEFLVEQVVNNYISNIAEEANNLIKAGEARLSFGEYDVALEKFAKLCELYPQDYRGWWGLIKAKTKVFTEILSTQSQLDEILELYKKVEIVSSGTLDEALADTFKSYVSETRESISSSVSQLQSRIFELKKERDLNKSQTEEQLAPIRATIKEKKMIRTVVCASIGSVLGILTLVLACIPDMITVAIVCGFVSVSAFLTFYKLYGQTIEEAEQNMLRISTMSLEKEVRCTAEINRLENELVRYR